VLDEASAEFIGEPDPPGRAGGGLLGGDEPVVDPAVHGGGNDAELARRFGDADRIGVGGFGAGPVASYLPVGAKAGHDRGGERLAASAGAALLVEDTGDGRVRVVNGQTAHEFD